jgi:hypothetical protein
MIVFGHHTEGIFQVEILGREFPNGMTEHVLAFGATAVVVALLAYGAWAVVRDTRLWVKRRRSVATPAQAQ